MAAEAATTTMKMNIDRRDADADNFCNLSWNRVVAL